MTLWSIFIRRPVATSLLMLALALPGLLAVKFLPISSLPMVDMPTIRVNANLPGANPETMAATVATPLERSLGRIAGITEMTSTSTQGMTRINIEFDIGRDVDGAAREVQAAINAARMQLPSAMISNPTYRKSNAAGSAVMAIALTSPTHTQAQLYDLAFSVLGQKIARVRGVGEVAVNGSALRSVRVEVNPTLLSHYGIGMEQVRAALAAANPNMPTGFIESPLRRWQIEINDRAYEATDFADLIVAWRNGAPVRLNAVAEVIDHVQEVRNAGSAHGKKAVMMTVFNEPGANVVETVDAVKALLPRLQAGIPAAVEIEVMNDRSTTIRKSLREAQHTLLIALGLVVLVTFAFLRNARATLIPAIAIPVTLLATLAVIHLCGFSLNNLSLMALIIAISFIVDDAIVVVENVSRHMERGLAPLAAALRGVREVGFTILAMNLALVAVFTPLIFMGGVLGRLFREFSITLAVAVAVSLLISLTATPMLCARLLKAATPKTPAAAPRWRQPLSTLALFTARPFRGLYQRSLGWALRFSPLMLLLFAATVALNLHFYQTIPKGFFPAQDTGRLNGFIQADQSSSFQQTREKIGQLMQIIAEEPAIESYYEYTGGGGGGTANTGTFFARLKPLEQRNVSAQQVVNRLRPKLAEVAGATLFVNSQQELNIGARSGAAQYQFTLLGSELEELRGLIPATGAVLARLSELTDVSADYQDRGLQLYLEVNREAAQSLGFSASQIDTALNNAFGQRVVTTLYEWLNQYFVVLTLAPEFTRDPLALEQVYLITAEGGRVPLSSIARWETRNTPLAVNHQGQFAAATISFNLAPNVSLEQATAAIERAFAALNPPSSVQGRFAGAAKAFQDSLASQPWLILAALLAVYIVLGMLYESTIHPLTILSTLPSAGVGALLALILLAHEFTLIALIGVILVAGIVMKNAVIMIDCALQLEREQQLNPRAAICEACRLRFRPIMMTSLAAILGALPLALGSGDGAELRQPLGIAIIGGLLFGQLLTLYTTPAVYLALDHLRHNAVQRWRAQVNKNARNNGFG